MAALLVPVYAHAQTPDRIAIIDNFGTYESGEPLFIYGSISNLSEGSFLILQIINPLGDMCQIQQLTPLPSGEFITDIIPLKGRICGIAGQYDVQLFYGDYTKSTTFSVSSDSFEAPTAAEKLNLARNLTEKQAGLIANKSGITHQIPGTDATLEDLENAYALLWSSSFSEEYLYEVNPLIREAVSTSLDSVQKLLKDNVIPFEVSVALDTLVYRAIFNYEIGNRAEAIGLLSDAFVDVKNITPEKTVKRELTFDELEGTLLNLMTKSGTILGKDVRSEVAFIFSRGTAPIYSVEISSLVDILTEARYLDVVSRKQSTLYNIVHLNWDNLKPSLKGKNSIEDLLESSEKVSKLYDAAILLRELDNVGRFISSDAKENSDLANLIMPEWDSLESLLARATTVDDILKSKPEILKMKQIIEISSRISKTVEISRLNSVSSSPLSGWSALLDKVKNAKSADEILGIVAEFDRLITELREKRSPLVTLEFRYTELKQKAELQADYENLVTIGNALKIINTAKQMESGKPSVSRIDRIELLLTWAGEQEPKIRNDLNSYTKDVSKVRSSNILERTQSLENLVELSITKNRFLPNYNKFTDGLNEKIAEIRQLVIDKDLDAAESILTSLYDEWTQVSKAYADNPRGSDVGYSLAELKRIEFRKKLDAFENTVTSFRNTGFEKYATEYRVLLKDLKNMISRANFVDAELKVTEIADFLSQNLVLSDPSIVFDIKFDQPQNLWVMSGAIEKTRFDMRYEMTVIIYDTDGSTHSVLEFLATKRGEFFVQWVAPTEPGLYVAKIQHKDPPKKATATQIVNIPHVFDYKYTASDLDVVSLARDFDDLKSFAVQFGGENYADATLLADAITSTETAFAEGNTNKIDGNLDKIKEMIDRYLPTRSREAIVEAVYADGTLVLSGAVIKDIAFREDLYVDVFDQRGDRMEEVTLKDDSTGRFAKSIQKSFGPGIYAVQLEYLNLTVSDFFIVD
ncbi:MAG: hypothetical protein D9C04_00665 [Nitrosopumilus sp. B06]|nr:MAG: hypothetical protein D9C04_00665 [Nitrosopumilus sp. B06]